MPNETLLVDCAAGSARVCTRTPGRGGAIAMRAQAGSRTRSLPDTAPAPAS